MGGAGGPAKWRAQSFGYAAAAAVSLALCGACLGLSAGAGSAKGFFPVPSTEQGWQAWAGLWLLLCWACSAEAGELLRKSKGADRIGYGNWLMQDAFGFGGRPPELFRAQLWPACGREKADKERRILEALQAGADPMFPMPDGRTPFGVCAGSGFEAAALKMKEMGCEWERFALRWAQAMPDTLCGYEELSASWAGAAPAAPGHSAVKAFMACGLGENKGLAERMAECLAMGMSSQRFGKIAAGRLRCLCASGVLSDSAGGLRRMATEMGPEIVERAKSMAPEFAALAEKALLQEQCGAEVTKPGTGKSI